MTPQQDLAEQLYWQINNICLGIVIFMCMAGMLAEDIKNMKANPKKVIKKKGKFKNTIIELKVK